MNELTLRAKITRTPDAGVYGFWIYQGNVDIWGFQGYVSKQWPVAHTDFGQIPAVPELAHLNIWSLLQVPHWVGPGDDLIVAGKEEFEFEFKLIPI